MHLQCKIYATGGSKQKCKHSSRANRATCSFCIAKAKAVCTCFNHHSHRPSLPASGSPWSLKFLKQRVQKESEKEIQWSVVCPVLCVVAHHLRMVQVIKHSMELLPAVEKSLKAAQVDQIWGSCLWRNFYDLPSFLQLFRRFMLVCFNKMCHFQSFNLWNPLNGHRLS